VGEFIFVSGQLGVAEDGTIPADGAAQADLAFLALERVLAEGGATLSDIVQLQTFHKGGMAATNEWFLPSRAGTSLRRTLRGPESVSPISAAKER
jgi:enamine deaminase RidA (YjgF/YER057c/UK114 family)